MQILTEAEAEAEEFWQKKMLTRSSPRLIYMPTLATDIVLRLFTLESIGLVDSF